MKTFLPLLLLALIAPLLSAQDDGETPLTRAMGTLQKSTRALGKVIEDPAKTDEALRLLAAMEEAALVSVQQAAPAPEGLTGRDLLRFQVGYRRACVGLVDAILAAEQACLSEDGSGRKEAYAEILRRKKAGHDTYK